MEAILDFCTKIKNSYFLALNDLLDQSKSNQTWQAWPARLADYTLDILTDIWTDITIDITNDILTDITTDIAADIVTNIFTNHQLIL